MAHRWHCDTCPFATSDPQARRGHETFLDDNPRGWFGRGERHHMVEGVVTVGPWWAQAAENALSAKELSR